MKGKLCCVCERDYEQQGVKNPLGRCGKCGQLACELHEGDCCDLKGDIPMPGIVPLAVVPPTTNGDISPETVITIGENVIDAEQLLETTLQNAAAATEMFHALMEIARYPVDAGPGLDVTEITAWKMKRRALASLLEVYRLTGIMEVKDAA